MRWPWRPWWTGGLLLRFDTGVLDDPGVARDFGAQVGGELLRSVDDDIDSLLGEAVANLIVVERGGKRVKLTMEMKR